MKKIIFKEEGLHHKIFSTREYCNSFVNTAALISNFIKELTYLKTKF
jgi:hypothetical protein